jgi:sugar lactone lactonase YvrE
MVGDPVCVAPTGDVCGEGAVWHAAHDAVYWTDINRFLIHRFTPADQSVRTWFFEEPVTALTLTDRSEVLAVVLGSRVILWEPATDTRQEPLFCLEGWPAVRLNDARVDPRGSLWMGTMRNNVNPDGTSSEAGEKDGVLFRLDPDAKVSMWRRDIGIANTLTWSPDHRRFYFGDSLANVIWQYDYDADVSFALRPMERLIASSKCPYRTLRPARLAEPIARRFTSPRRRPSRPRETDWLAGCMPFRRKSSARLRIRSAYSGSRPGFPLS